MTGRQAQQKLLKPVFGDESHIEALKIYRQVRTGQGNTGVKPMKSTWITSMSFTSCGK
jgi:hypothetical protein